MFGRFSVENYVQGSITVLLFVMVAMGGLILVRRRSDPNLSRDHHGVAGNLFSVGGTFYAVLLGLIVVDAINNFQLARFTVRAEADSLANIFVLAERLPTIKADRIKELCTKYAREVAENEWELLNHRQVSKKARILTFLLIRETANVEPVTENQKAVYPLMLQEALELRDNRRSRVSMTIHSIPTVEWVVLGLGALVTVVFTYFFRLDSLRTQLSMTGMVALLIALNIYLVILFGSPFSGDLRVQPDPFIADLELFNHGTEKMTDM